MPTVNDKFIELAPLWSGTIGSGGVPDGSTTTIPLASTNGLVDGNVYVLTIDRVDANGTKTPSKREVVIGKVSGNNLINCLRGVEGTAQAHSAGAVVELLFTAKQWNRLIEGVRQEHNDDGTHKQHAWVSVSDGSTITFDLSLGNKQVVTLGGNRTLALSNVSNGHVFLIKLKQDATGSRTVTWWDGISWAGGTEPTLTTTPDKSDVFGFIQTGSNTYDGFVVGQNI